MHGKTSTPIIFRARLQLAGPKGLTAHVRRQKTRPSRSLLLQREARQASGKPSNDVDNGIVGFGTTDSGFCVRCMWSCGNV